MLLQSRRIAADPEVADRIAETIQELYPEFTKVRNILRFFCFLKTRSEVEIFSIFPDQESAERGFAVIDGILACLTHLGINDENSFENREGVSMLMASGDQARGNQPGDNQPVQLNHVAGWRTKILGDDAAFFTLEMALAAHMEQAGSPAGFSNLIVSRPDPYSLSIMYVARKNSELRRFEEALNGMITDHNARERRLEFSPSETMNFAVPSYLCVKGPG